MEACEQIMSRGDADFMLCHYHRDAMPRLEASQFTSVVIGRDVLLPLCAPSEMVRHNGRCLEILRLRRACCRTGRNPPRSDRDGRPDEELADAFTPEDAHGTIGGDAADHGASRRWYCVAAANPRPRRRRTGRLVDPGHGSYSIEVEIRLIRPLRRQAPPAEAFWKSVAGERAHDELVGKTIGSSGLVTSARPLPLVLTQHLMTMDSAPFIDSVCSHATKPTEGL